MTDEIWVDVKVVNPLHKKRSFTIQAQVDSGSLDSAMPKKLLRRIGIRPAGRATYEAWAGKTHRREWGEVRFHIQGKFGTSRVTFELEKEIPTIGALTLETLGFDIDMINGRLHPHRIRPGRGPRRRKKAPLRGRPRP